MRGTQLATLRQMLKAELGYNQDSTTQDQELNLLLANKQKFLGGEFDWPFLQGRWDLEVVAGTRYIGLPLTQGGPTGQQSAINFERPVLYEVKYSLRWQEIHYSVDSEEYNFLDSDRAGMVMNPIQRWRFATDSSEPSDADQIEVWPIPSITQATRFTGQRTIQDLIADTDVADLDDLLLVLMVAAEKLTRMKMPDAPLKTALAQERMMRIRAAYPTKQSSTIIGGNLIDKPRRRRVPITIIAG